MPTKLLTRCREASSVRLTIDRVTSTSNPGWNSFARTNASDRFRKQSAMMGSPLTELIVARSDIQPHLRMLDIASGTGEPAISIADKLKGTGEVTATDISVEPLKIAEQRAQQRGLKNIRLQQADAHQLPFEDKQFDRVTCRLGLMFFANLPMALGEIHRVLKPGGRFTAVAWGPMQQPYFEATIGTVLQSCPGIAVPEGAQSMFKFGEKGVLTHNLREVGFSQAKDELIDVDWTWHGSPEELWDYFQAVTIPFAPLFKAIPEERRAEMNAAVIEVLRRLARGGLLPFVGRFVLAEAIA